MGRDPVARAAGLALILVLAVVAAAAGIRLGADAAWLRPVHRIAASLEVLVMAWLCWKAWRRPAIMLALVLTALLSVVGILGGQRPPPAIAAANLLGGLALAATFAWIARNRGRLPVLAAVLLAVQIGLGAWLALVDRWSPVLPAHAMLALPVAALLAWAGFRLKSIFLVVLALTVPLAGFTSLHYDSSPGAALAHAAAAALLVAAAALFLRPLTHIKGLRAPR